MKYLYKIITVIFLLLSIGILTGFTNEQYVHNDYEQRKSNETLSDSVTLFATLTEVENVRTKVFINLDDWRYYAWINGKSIGIDSTLKLTLSRDDVIELKGKIVNLSSPITKEFEETNSVEIPVEKMLKKGRKSSVLTVSINLNDANAFLDTQLYRRVDELVWKFYYNLELEQVTRAK